MEELLKELEELKQKIADIENKIAKKKVETGRWKPEEGDTYWFINDIGDICKSTWDNVNTDRKRYLIGNCYQTKEECEFAKEKLKVIAELKEYAEPKDRAWDGTNIHYYICCSYTPFKEVGIICTNCVKRNEIYFETKEKALQAIDAVGEERIKKYYLEVKE
jgi:hypothetical protein